MDIPALLDSLCLSQAEIADHLGVTQSTISRWRTGALVPDRRTQLALEALTEKLKQQANHADNNTDAAPDGSAGKSSDFTPAPEWPVEKVGAA